MQKTMLPLLLCALLAGPAWAAGEMKPGLWEVTMKSNALKNLPQIPPEQMEQMRKMGVNVPQFKDGGIVSKVCVTPEMATRQAPGLDKMETGCQAKNHKRSGNSYSADIVCTGGDLKGTGKVAGTMSGSERFSSTYDFKGSMHGEPVAHHQESSGRWLAKDCGNVRAFGN